MATHPFKMVALWCSYRGANFHGYQQQGHLRTVQRELLRAYAEAGLIRNPVVAGRTDKGVNARMQVLSGRLERAIEPHTLPGLLNARLPDDIRIHVAREVPKGFHAAFSSSSKEYRYTVLGDVDLEVLQRAAELVPGTRDFSVFHFKSSQKKNRTVKSVEWLPERKALRFVGEGFARHMVRMLVGAMTAVARGTISLETFQRGLELQENFDCPTAEPEPLTLWEVGYPADVDPFTSEERTQLATSTCP